MWCPVDSYSVMGSGEITNCSCAAGWSGSNGECSRCMPGEFRPFIGAAKCTACAVGKYSSTAALSCVYCTARTYAADDRSECILCPENSYSAVGSSAISNCSCNAGWWGADGACSRCVPGKFSPNDGAAVCTACAAGTYSNTTASRCVNCKAGSYSAHDKSGCLSCPANSNSTVASGAVEACYCNAGWWTVNKNNNTAFFVCKQIVASCWITGTMTSNPNCGCPVNQYEVAILCVDCLPTDVYCAECPANTGSLSRGNNITTCVCNAGWTGSNSVCTACVSGKYKASNGSEECAECVQDSYVSTDNTACLPCPLNTFSPIATDDISLCSSSKCGKDGQITTFDGAQRCGPDGSAGTCTVYAKSASNIQYMLDGLFPANNRLDHTRTFCDCWDRPDKKSTLVIDLQFSHEIRSVEVWHAFDGYFSGGIVLSASEILDGQTTHACSVGLLDVYWNNDMIEQVKGNWKFNLRDHAFTFPGIREAFPRHIEPSFTFDVITGHELQSLQGTACHVLFWQVGTHQWYISALL